MLVPVAVRMQSSHEVLTLTRELTRELTSLSSPTVSAWANVTAQNTRANIYRSNTSLQDAFHLRHNSHTTDRLRLLDLRNTKFIPQLLLDTEKDRPNSKILKALYSDKHNVHVILYCDSTVYVVYKNR